MGSVWRRGCRSSRSRAGTRGYTIRTATTRSGGGRYLYAATATLARGGRVSRRTAGLPTTRRGVPGPAENRIAREPSIAAHGFVPRRLSYAFRRPKLFTEPDIRLAAGSGRNLPGRFSTGGWKKLLVGPSGRNRPKAAVAGLLGLNCRIRPIVSKRGIGSRASGARRPAGKRAPAPDIGIFRG